MKTDQEIKQIANKYLSFLERKMNIKLLFFDGFDKKPYGNIFHYFAEKNYDRVNRKVYNSSYFLVEKTTGRIVTFGTQYPEEEYIKAYEDGVIDQPPCSTKYWYPDTETYSHE